MICPISILVLVFEKKNVILNGPCISRIKLVILVVEALVIHGPCMPC